MFHRQLLNSLKVKSSDLLCGRSLTEAREKAALRQLSLNGRGFELQAPISWSASYIFGIESASGRAELFNVCAAAASGLLQRVECMGHHRNLIGTVFNISAH
jgi:hypothetical protein